jgi:uncharacterized membrane protein YfhO
VPEPRRTTGPEELRVVTYLPQRIVVEASLAAPGVLVLSEVWYPGWTVRVDGKAAPSLRAFGLLRATALPAGQHTVEWRYTPWTVYISIAISLLAIAGLIGAVRQQRRGETAEPRIGALVV